MPPIAGILVFVLVVAALFALFWILGRRYVRGRDPRVDEVTRETGLRDGNAGLPTGGFLPWPSVRGRSPRDRLREPETPDRE
ncbi:MAG TPA: hypothetical protein VJQ09_04195 [Candidatus Limnocylindria bacterium]|nr:hypothetical protein [Candidatus Limnocylindria bacterium]